MEGRTVDRCVSTNLHVVLNDDFADLWNFMVAKRLGRIVLHRLLNEPVTVSPDHHTAMKDHAVADFAIVIDVDT